jgi:hypothetical protein
MNERLEAEARKLPPNNGAENMIEHILGSLRADYEDEGNIHGIRIIQDAEAQLERYRGALRTLAKWWNPTFGCMYCPCYEKCVPHVLSDEMCTKEVVSYALAHPTEEGK